MREIDSNGRQSFTIYVRVEKAENALQFTHQAFLAVDGDASALALRNQQESRRSSSSEDTRTEMITDSTGTRMVTLANGISTSEWKEEQFQCTLTPAQLQLLHGGQRIEFRFYEGPFPVPVILNTYQRDRLQKFAKIDLGAQPDGELKI